MTKLRQNEAYFSEKDQRWHIYVQSNGVRRHFVNEISVVIEESKYTTSVYRFKVDSYGLDDLYHNWEY